MPAASPLLAETMLYRFNRRLWQPLFQVKGCSARNVHFHGRLLSIGCVIDADTEPESTGRGVGDRRSPLFLLQGDRSRLLLTRLG
jgi:hypothetical protein